MRIPVIIDTDPGLDDAIALLAAFASEELDIKAITAVAGNQTLEKTLLNTAKIVEFAGVDMKIAAGAARPIKREPVIADEIHGESGIGSVVLPKPSVKVSEESAYRVIYDEAIAANGELQIIAIGPLTNIANTLLIYPDIKDKIKKIVIMGGGHAFGNVTPAAEFNFYADAEAAQLVFESGIPLVMVGLDATHQANIYEKDLGTFFDVYNDKTKVIEEFFESLLENSKSRGYDCANLHDVLAVVATYEPSVITGGEYHVDIETKGKVTYGKSVVDIYDTTKKDKNAFVALATNSDMFIEILKKKLKAYEG